MLWLVPLALLALALVYQLRQRPSIHRNGQRLRRPADTLPLLGNALRFLQPRHLLFDWFVQCQRHFGTETFEIAVPTLPPGVVIDSPEILEFVLKNEAVITKGEFFKTRSWDLFGYGIINATGDLWRAQRKAGLKFFSGANLDVMIEDVLPEYYEDTRKTLLQHSESSTPLDLQQLFLDLTTTVVGHMAYDMSISSTSPFSQAFDHASLCVSHRFQNPLYPLTELLLPSGSRFRSSLESVHAFGRHIVASARKRRSHAAFASLLTDTDLAASSFGSLIDALLETFNDDTVVADAAMNFLSAGRDTTAQSFTWMFYALSRHPEVLRKLRCEIDEKFPSISTPKATSPSPSPSPPTPPQQPKHATVEPDVDDHEHDHDHDHDHPSSPSPSTDSDDTTPISLASLQPSSLPYTMAVYYEALRLYPPVPIEIKQCTSPITLPDGTHLPASAVIVWCIWSLNRSPDLYGPDAETFRPERWLEKTNDDNDDEDRKYIFRGPQSAFTFPVFNGGPRACLGRKMAECMACWVLVRVLGEWDFDEVPLLDGDARRPDRVSQSSLTLPMLGGLPVRVRRRRARGGERGVRDCAGERRKHN